MRKSKPSRRFLFALALLLAASSSPPFLMAQSAEGSGDSSSDSLVWLTEEDYGKLLMTLENSETALREALGLLNLSPQELQKIRNLLPILSMVLKSQENLLATSIQHEEGLRQLLMESEELKKSLKKLNTGPMINLGLTADYGESGLRVGVSVGVTF